MENNDETPVGPVSLWVVTLIWASVLGFLMTGLASLGHAQALPANCGYTVNSGTYGTWPGGYQAWVELNNLSGETATDFEIQIGI